MQDSYINVWRGDYYDGHLWYPAQDDGLLLKINVETGQVDYVLSMLLPKEGLKHPYHQIVSLGDGEFLAVPGLAEKILRMDVKTQEQELYEFPGGEEPPTQYCKFYGAVKYDSKVYCFPGFMNCVLEIDCETMAVSARKDITDTVEGIRGETKIYFGWEVISDGNTVYAVSPKFNYILEMNLATKEYALHELVNEEGVCGFRGIGTYKDKIYVINEANHIRVYDLKTKEFLQQMDTTKKYLRVRRCKDSLVFIPASTDPYAFYLVETGEITEVSCPEEYHYANLPKSDMWQKDIIENDEKIFIISPFNNMLITIDKETHNIKFIPLYYGESLMQYLYERSGKLFREQNRISNYMSVGLEGFIDYVARERI